MRFSSLLDSVRSSLSSARAYSNSASGAFGGVQSAAADGRSTLSSVKSAADFASRDNEEIDSSGAGDTSALSSAGGAARGADHAASQAGDYGGRVKDALRDALSAAAEAVRDGGDASLRSRIEAALSDQDRAGSCAGYIAEAVDKVEWCLSRAVDDAGYIRSDQPGKDVSGYGRSMGGNADDAASAFSDAGSRAGSGGNSQDSVSRNISSALSEVDNLERALGALQERG